MKILSVLTLALITSLTFTSCDKTSSTPNTPAASSWLILGVTYDGTSTVTSGTSLISANAATDGLAINFATLPTANGTYTVSATTDATHCTVAAHVAATSTTYVGTAGTITVAVTGGKITANFESGLQVSSTGSPSVITTINGTLIQQ